MVTKSCWHGIHRVGDLRRKVVVLVEDGLRREIDRRRKPRSSATGDPHVRASQTSRSQRSPYARPKQTLQPHVAGLGRAGDDDPHRSRHHPRRLRPAHSRVAAHHRHIGREGWIVARLCKSLTPSSRWHWRHPPYRVRGCSRPGFPPDTSRPRAQSGHHQAGRGRWQAERVAWDGAASSNSKRTIGTPLSCHPFSHAISSEKPSITYSMTAGSSRSRPAKGAQGSASCSRRPFLARPALGDLMDRNEQVKWVSQNGDGRNPVIRQQRHQLGRVVERRVGHAAIGKVFEPRIRPR